MAGLGKLISPEQTIQVVSLVGVSPGSADLLIRVLPGMEIAIGCGLTAFRWPNPAHAFALALLIAFTEFLFLLGRVNYEAHCACFSPLVDSWAAGTPAFAIGRNILLILILLGSVVTDTVLAKFEHLPNET